MAAGSRQPVDGRTVLSLGDRFIELVRAADSPRVLFNLVESIAREMGYEYSALIHHVDLRQPRPGIININNYPDGWRDTFIEQRLFLDDPALQACLRCNEAFVWSDIPRLVRIGPKQEAILSQASRAGLRHGVTIPASVRGEGVRRKQEKGTVSRQLPSACLHIVFSRDMPRYARDMLTGIGGNPPFVEPNREIGAGR